MISWFFSISAGAMLPLRAERKTIWIDSLNDVNSPANVKLALQKGHRLLDTLARLIAMQLRHNKSYAGSLSLVFTQNNLLISTKRNVSREEITKALQHVLNDLMIYKERDFKYNNLIKREKAKIKHLKQKLMERTNMSNYTELVGQILTTRASIDKIKFMRALSFDYTDDLSQHIKRFFSSSNYEQGVIVINNPEGFHSEIQLATYVKEQGLCWKKLEASSIAYQYIGGSMRSCCFCDSLIRGAPGVNGLNEQADKKMVFFIRSSYPASNDSYNLPAWSLELNNNLPIEDLNKMLWRDNKSKKYIQRERYFDMKETELSESE
jgi:hypothetical protein